MITSISAYGQDIFPFFCGFINSSYDTPDIRFDFIVLTIFCLNSIILFESFGNNLPLYA